MMVELKREIAEAEESLAFWRDQPPSLMGPLPSHIVDLSLTRVSDLETDIAALRETLQMLEDYIAQGS